MNELTPEKALALIQEAALTGSIKMADNTQSAALDEEIQAIFVTVRVALTGKMPKRDMFAADRSTISDVLPLSDSGGTAAEGIIAVAKTSKELGIELSHKDTWIDAALKLRAKRAKTSD
jgi:hypothetical protein